MSIKCGKCGKTHSNSFEVGECYGIYVNTSRSIREEPYRSSPGHDLFVNVGPNIEAWDDATATAGGTCSCGWTRQGLANRTAVVLAWNKHVDE